MDIEEQINRLKEEGNSFYGRNEPEKAIEAYTKGLDLDSKNHLLLSNRAAAHLKISNFEQAILDAKKCIEIEPKWARGYTRLSQAYVRMQKYNEAKEVLIELEKIDPEERNIELIRQNIATKEAFDQLKGSWYGTVSEELGGYVQTFDFMSETKVLVSVFGRQLMANLKLKGSTNDNEPGHLDFLILPSEPGQPPAPEVIHIFRIEKDELHLCSPYMQPPEQRPTSFDGPAYVVMHRGNPPVDNALEKKKLKINKMDVNQRCLAFTEEVSKILPDVVITPELEQNPESAEAQKAMLETVKFQNACYELKQIYGADSEELLQFLMMGQASPATPQLGKAVKNLRAAMQSKGLFPSDEQIAQEQQLYAQQMAGGGAVPQVSSNGSSPATKKDNVNINATSNKTKIEASAVDAPSVIKTPSENSLGVIVAIGVAAVAATAIALFVLKKKN